MSKIVLFQAIQFSISTQFSSIWPIHSTLSGATMPGLSRPGDNGNEGVLHIPQSSSITGTSPSDCLVLYPGHSLGGVPLQKWSQCILQPKPTWQYIFWVHVSSLCLKYVRMQILRLGRPFQWGKLAQHNLTIYFWSFTILR